MTGDRLFRKNIAVFRKRFPKGVVKALLAMRPANTKLVWSADGKVASDVTVGGQSLYNGDATDRSRAQVHQQLENPDRLIQPFPDVRNAAPLVAEDTIKSILTAMQGKSIDTTPDETADVAIVLGLGLGLHLPVILEATTVRHLIVVEPNPELLHASLHALDWAALYKTVEARGGTLVFDLLDNPEAKARQLLDSLRKNHFSTLDGAYFFQHYAHPLLRKFRAAIASGQTVLHGSTGFFEDELRMLEHGRKNLAGYRSHILPPWASRDDPGLPAFIVGSGPSLDSALPDLKRLAANAVIFSGGSATYALSMAGIDPDFHCQLENHPEEGDLYCDRLSRDIDFGEIDLIAATSVSPRLPALFKRRILVHRELLLPTRLFAKEGHAFDGAAVSAIVLALRAAIAFGFRRIYLIGMDFGTRNPIDLHSRHFPARHWNRDHYTPMNQPALANFGGIAYTEPKLTYVSGRVSALLSGFPSVQCFNCSDGIAVDGACPMRLESCEPPETAASKRDTIDELVGDLPEYSEEPSFFDSRVDRFVDAVHALSNRLSASEEQTFKSLHAQCLAEFQRLGKPTDKSIESSAALLAYGSLMLILQFGYGFRRRLPEADRREFDKAFANTFADAVDRMRRETVDVLQEGGTVSYRFRQDALDKAVGAQAPS